MSKIAIVYWSGTGNTEAMASAVAESVKGKGAEVDMFGPEAFTADMVAGYTAFAFGCPSMGAEVLEECDYQPMWDGVKGALSGKTVALFGSYGWGDGEWMRNWESDCEGAGAQVVGTVICNEAPDDAGLAECQELGAKLV